MRIKLFLLGSAMAVLLPGSGVADWVPSTLDQRCEAEDIDGIANSIRDAIEASVRRAEASIQAPTPIGDLGCLDDLMNAPLDIFSNVGGIMDTLSGGLFDSLSFPIDMDASGMLCDFAAAKWGELTGGLGDLGVDIAQFSNTPASMADRLLGGGGFGSGSGSTGSSGQISMSLPGTSSLSAVNAPTGTARATVPVSTETGLIPIYTEHDSSRTAEGVFNEAAFMSAYRIFENDRQVAMAQYTACEVARRLSSSGYWGGFTGTCTAPTMLSEPNYLDFVTPASAPASGGTTSSTLSTFSTGSSEPTMSSSPSALIGAPRSTGSGTGTTTGSGTTSSTIESIWGRF